ncbi:AAA domain-containing protein [uncultured Bradyrhizobium sp.]|uniref:AAA domain-containing protein n=1 Tax=uncultured Bradyrhizobium sp. TaxID=199684 RepID=UPI0035CBD712
MKDIWRSEIRQLQRLAAVPKADDLFVPMITAGSDKDAFYIVLDPARGDPLETFRKATSKPLVLSAPRLPRNRRLLWENFLRIARALELLHSQGIIHRNLDPWSIIGSFGEHPDFRLTGFEWSMRLATVEDVPRAGAGGAESQAASFGQDWRNLGLMIAELLDVSPGRVVDLRLLLSEVADHLSISEVRILRKLTGAIPVERLDGDRICREISDVIETIQAQAAGGELKLAAAFRLDPRSPLTKDIRHATGNQIEATDVEGLVAFVKDDLAGEPYLTLVKDGRSGAKVALLGNQMTYWLSPYRAPGTTDVPTFEFAVCETAELARPRTIVESEVLVPEMLDILPAGRAQEQSFARRRGRVADWQPHIDALRTSENRKTDLDRKYEAFALLTALEMAYAVADIFPISVKTGRPSEGGSHGIVAISRYDEERDALSKALLFRASPAVRLSELLDKGEASDRGSDGWTLAQTGSLGERDAENHWRYVGAERGGQGEIFKFEGSFATRIRDEAFLIPGEMKGKLTQLRRRLKALRALREHSEMLRMLTDPRGRIEDSHDPIKQDNDFKSLDRSKQEALSGILSTIPFFLLQGPPGVGKTYLVSEIVRRRFTDEPTTRLLLSAQSNAAIDHLMKEVIEMLPKDVEPVKVRARPADDDISDTDLEIDRQADYWLDALAKSDLVEDADPSVREKIRDLAAVRRAKAKPNATRAMAAEARAFEAMILRSANLVFATTNSAAVEQLIEESSLFDWTIVEEAGKATGSELLSPLLLSHRRLMIGDHQQLAPYGADTMIKLLSSAESVKKALRAAEPHIARYQREPGIEDVFNVIDVDNADFGRLCADTLSALSLFETLVRAETAAVVEKGKARRPIFHKLNEQHRMHPAIAKIVSDCFYEGTLKTNEKVEKKYRDGTPPFRFLDSRLPERPVIFIDMPYSRETIGYRGGDRLPPWTNPDEVTAALQVLRLLRAVGRSRPSLAVLSPYNEQVKRLRQNIRSEKPGSLKHLSGFQPALGEDDYCGTVDSFQGDQADAILISLVRNNEKATVKGALGFLDDSRRMNVLLSRAKWRMIVIGSLSFYRHVMSYSEKASGIDKSSGADIEFLKKFLVALNDAERNGDASIVPWSTLRKKP